MRKMTKEQKEEYNRLTKDAEQIRLDLEALSRMTYGYARVSTKTQARDGNSLESQKAALKAAGATEIFVDAFTTLSPKVASSNTASLTTELSSPACTLGTSGKATGVPVVSTFRPLFLHCCVKSLWRTIFCHHCFTPLLGGCFTLTGVFQRSCH